jgi:hypothetical protein
MGPCLACVCNYVRCILRGGIVVWLGRQYLGIFAECCMPFFARWRRTACVKAHIMDALHEYILCTLLRFHTKDQRILYLFPSLQLPLPQV